MASNHAEKVNPSGVKVLGISTGEYEFTSVHPTSISNDDVVTVKFFSTQPNATDWIGAYRASANVSATSPIKFGRCSQQSGYLSSGAGHLIFNLTNIRSDIVFHYFKNGFQHPILTISSEPISFIDTNQPLRNRIVPTGDPNVFSLTWSSATTTQPVLKWGTEPGTYTKTVPAITTTITKDNLCGGTAATVGWHDLGLLHTANITGIIEGNLGSRRIFYTFGDVATDNFSPEKTFQVPPNAGYQPYDHYAAAQSVETENIHALSANGKTSVTTTATTSATTTTTTTATTTSTSTTYIASRPTQIVLMADLGIGASDSSADTEVFSEACLPALNTTKSIGGRVLRGEVDAVLLSGDLAYANGYLSNWDFFLDALSPITGGALFLSTVGNHESDWLGSDSLYQGKDSGGECGLSAQLLPLPAPANKLRPYWSYDVGLVHLVGMSTEHNYSEGSAQYAWLEQDLAAVNRSLTPWIIFTGHRPAYVDSQFCCGWGIPEGNCGGQCAIYSDVTVMQQLQQHIDPLLFKYQVNLAFAGHFHNVQRQSAVYQGIVVQASVPTVDAQGNVVHHYHNPQATVHMVIGSAGNGPTYSNKFYPWSEASWDNLYGYAVVTAVNATYLQWQFIESATDKVVDSVVITQDFTRWTLPHTHQATKAEYDSRAQIVVIVIGTLILVMSLVCAVFHTRTAKLALRLLNNRQHQLLDQTEHSNGRNGELNGFGSNSSDDGVV